MLFFQKGNFEKPRRRPKCLILRGKKQFLRRKIFMSIFLHNIALLVEILPETQKLLFPITPNFLFLIALLSTNFSDKTRKYMRKNGDNCVVVCIVEFAAKHIIGSWSAHVLWSFPCSIALKNLPKSRCNLSVMLDQ